MSVNLIVAPGQEGYLFDCLNMKVCCVFLLQSPHRGHSNGYTQYTILNIKKKITLNYSKSAVKLQLKSNGNFSRDSRMSLKRPW